MNIVIFGANYHFIVVFLCYYKKVTTAYIVINVITFTIKMAFPIIIFIGSL